MHRALLVLAALGAGFLLGCPGIISPSSEGPDAGDGTLFVVDVLAPQAAPGGYTDDPSQPSIASGTLDLALRQPYEPTYLLGSQFAAAGAADVTTVQGAKIRITDASGNQVNTFTALLTSGVTISPPPGSTVGYAPAMLRTLDPAMLDDDTALQTNVANGATTQLTTYVTFFGQAMDGTGVESAEFAFPVDVCRGCLGR
jgi:hypothetical protein